MREDNPNNLVEQLVFHASANPLFSELVINDFNHACKINKSIQEHIKAIEFTKIEYTRLHHKMRVQMGGEKKVQDTAIQNLLFNMSNSDAGNLLRYIDRRTQYLTDKTFHEYDGFAEPQQIDDLLLYTTRQHLDVKYETPFALKFQISKNEKNSDRYTLPIVYYGVSEEGGGEKVAVVYGVHNMTDGIDVPDEIKKAVNGVNTNVSKNRGCPPKHVLSLARFISMAHESGVRHILAPDFLPARYQARSERVDLDGRNDAIQTNLTEGLVTLFLRMEDQINGATITSFPGDGDGYTRMKLDEKLSTRNVFLSKAAGMDLSAQKEQYDERNI
ncbi:MAG: hypothetical protein FWE16_03290 [Firmicutes bacterium]|nr:hypothetical protein [Bacillota bacterium]